MVYSAKVGSFNIDTSKTLGQTQAITGVGFQPKVVLFWWGGSTDTGDAVGGGDINMGFGAAISSSSRFCINGFSLDGAATSDASSEQDNDTVITIYSDAATVDGDMDLQSMDSDGFTLVVDNQFTIAARIHYLALGGDDLTNVYLGSQVTPATPGEYGVTGVGFQPDAVIIVGRPYSAATGLGTNQGFTIGLATGSGAQGVAFGYSQDGVATSNSYGYGYNGDDIGDTANSRERFVSFGADGFTQNHLEGVARYYYFICLKGGSYSVGDLTTRTDSNDISETVGFHPRAILFASANRALSTEDTSSAHNRISIGAASSASERACMAISDEDNLADTETARASYDSAVYAHVEDDAIAGLMDIKSIDASGFTCVMDDTDPSGCWVTYLAFGPTPATQACAGTLSLGGNPSKQVLTPRLGALTMSGDPVRKLLRNLAGALTPRGARSSIAIICVGPYYPGTAATVSETPYDDDTWLSINNIKATDTSYASIVASSYDADDYSYVMQATNFGLDAVIPSNAASIAGIKVEVRGYGLGGTSCDALAQLCYGGSRVGDNKATSTNWGGSFSIKTYGGSADTWGAGLTVAQVRDSSFGVHYVNMATGPNADVYIDYIRITVCYTVASGQTLEQSAAGALTLAGEARAKGKKVLAGVSSIAGDSAKKVKRVFSGAWDSTGDAIKKPLRSLAGVLSTVGAVTTIKKVIKALEGALAASGDIIRKTGYHLAGILYLNEPVRHFIEFNGSSTKIECGSDSSLDDIPLDGSFTIDCWLTHHEGMNYGTIISKIVPGDDMSPGGWLEEIYITDVLWMTIVGQSGAWAWTHTVEKVSRDVWHHITMTYDDTTKKAYFAIDGVWCTYSVQDTLGTYLSDGSYNLQIGYWNADPPQDYWRGGIAWMRISSGDRFGIGVNFTPPPKVVKPEADGNTIELWQLEEGEGATAYAEVVSANNGTITNGTWNEFRSLTLKTITERIGALLLAGNPIRKAKRLLEGAWTSAGDLVRLRTKALAGAIASSGVLLGKGKKALPGTWSSTGDLWMYTKTVLAGVWSGSGNLVTRLFKVVILVGEWTGTGVLVGKGKKALSGALTFAGALLGRAKKALAGATALAGVTYQKTRTTLSGALASAGTLLGKGKKVLSGAATLAGVTYQKTKTTLTGIWSSIGAAIGEKVAGLQYKAIDGALTFVGDIRRSTSTLRYGAVTFAGATYHKTKTLLAGALAFVGNAYRKTTQVFAGAITFVGGLRGKAKLVLLGAWHSAGDVRSKTRAAVAGALTYAGNIQKRTATTLAGIWSSIGDVVGERLPGLIKKALDGAIATSGTLAKGTATAISGILATVGSLTRTGGKALSGVLSSSGQLGVLGRKLLAGALGAGGAILRSVRTNLTGAMSLAGSLSRRTKTTVVGALTSIGDLAAQRIANLYYQAIEGALNTAGTLSKRGAKILSGGLNYAGELSRKTSTTLNGALSTLGSLAAQLAGFYQVNLAGVLAPTGAVTRRVRRILSGVLNFIGRLISLGPPETVSFIVYITQNHSADTYIVQAMTADTYITQEQSLDVEL